MPVTRSARLTLSSSESILCDISGTQLATRPHILIMLRKGEIQALFFKPHPTAQMRAHTNSDPVKKTVDAEVVAGLAEDSTRHGRPREQSKGRNKETLAHSRPESAQVRSQADPATGGIDTKPPLKKP